MSSRFIQYILPAAAMLLLASCALFKKNAQPEPITMPEIQVSSVDPMESFRATATQVWDLAHTGIDIRFSLKERSADGIATLSLHPHYYPVDTVVLDAKGMKIGRVIGADGRPLSFRYDSLQLTIKLDKTYTHKDTLHLEIAYTALPYAGGIGGSDAIREDRGLYFVNTDGAEPYQPVQIWTQGETQASSRWFPTFDYPVFRSTFTITMHVPDSFKTLSNGTLVRSVKETNSMRADTWNQDKPISPYLAMMAAGDFAIAKESWKGKEVSYYVPQEYGPWAKDIFRHTPEMIGFFSDLLGVEYPWDKYSQVVGYNYVSGAMENVSASLFGAFNLKDRRQIEDEKNDYIVAHELFHQWFGDYVTAESWSNLTLNESFADFSEHLWSEHKYGKEARQAVWMQGLSKYLTQARRSDPPLVRFHYRSQEDMFDRVSYSKGGLILYYMRQLTGDEAFFDALQLYLKQNALHSAEATQLRLALEQVTGRDWNWFFNQWYYRGGHPVLDISYQYDDAAAQMTVKIKQAQPDSVGLYILPLKAQILVGGRATEVSWNISKKEESYTYPYVQGKRPVIVPDAGHWMPGEIWDRKSAWQWQQQYLYSGDHISKRLALAGCAALKKNDTAQEVFFAALQDQDPFLRQMAVNSKDYESNKQLSEAWIGRIVKIAQEDTDSKARSSALNALGTLEDKQYSSIIELAIQDSSYRVAAAALNALSRINPKRAQEYARNLHPETMKGNVLLYRAATIIAMEGKAEDYPFFEQKTLQLFESNRKNFLIALQQYLVTVQDEVTYKKGLDFLLRLSTADIAAGDAFYNGAILFNIMSYAGKQAKIATDKAAITEAVKRKELAALAWDAYKHSVTDENTKTDIATLEKE